MITTNANILLHNEDARSALRAFDRLAVSTIRTLFILNDENQMVGTLTDGDIRRGLLSGLEISQPINLFMNKGFKFISAGEKNTLEQIKLFRRLEFDSIPMLAKDRTIIQIIDLRKIKTLIPASALIMAGGKGERLKPLTDHTPKPMLKIGEKPILEYNIERLISYGITQIFISVKYLKNQIIDYFGDGSDRGINIKYIEEDNSLGTLGSLSLIEKIENEDILVMNSDLLTNVDFEDFFTFYKQKNALMAVASVPYTVNIPYAVLETDNHHVNSFVEKPTYTYYSNGGIYFLKFSLKDHFKKNTFFNATDLMDVVLAKHQKALVHYPLLCYWLDIGKYQDFSKAQEDIKHIQV